MKGSWIYIYSIFMIASISWAEVSFPQLIYLEGTVWVTHYDGQKKRAVLNEKLKGSASLTVQKDSILKVKIDKERVLILFADTEVQIPAISWDGGEAPIIILKKGSFRWQCQNEKPSYTILLRSDLFDLIAPAGDFIFIYDPERLWTEVKTNRGRIEFSAMNGDRSVVLEKNQKASFQGIKEQGEIVYDVLLHGKKVPRGQISGPIAMTNDEIHIYSEDAEKQRTEKKIQKIKEEKKRIAILRKGQICKDPYARFGECSWVCKNNPQQEKKICQLNLEGVQCVRSRCNANGEWADSTILTGGSAQFCKAQTIVSKCDY